MYFGKVVNINDNLKLGRVKVKVYDLHDNIKTVDLPWSQVMMPGNTPAISGQGHSVNLAVGSFTDVEYETERFDLNGDYNTSNYTFTAPVTGKYQFNVNVRLLNVDTAHTHMGIRLNTSNRNYDTLVEQPDHTMSSDGGNCLACSYLVDMDAADTAKIQFECTSGSAQTDVQGGNSYFMGYLVA